MVGLKIHLRLQRPELALEISPEAYVSCSVRNDVLSGCPVLFIYRLSGEMEPFAIMYHYPTQQIICISKEEQ